MKINSRYQVKMLLDKRKVRLTELAQMLTEKTGKKYTLGGLSQKLGRGSLSYDEMLIICEILDYRIEFIDNNID